VFNLDKLNSINFHHLRKKSEEEVLQILKIELSKSKFTDKNFSDVYLLQVMVAMRERMTFVKDIIQNASYFFESPTEYDQASIKRNWKEETPTQLKMLAEEFSKLNEPIKQDYENTLHSTAEKLQIGNGKLIHATRLAISGVSAGPGLYDILFILGKEESVKRMNVAIEKIKL